MKQSLPLIAHPRKMSCHFAMGPSLLIMVRIAYAGLQMANKICANLKTLFWALTIVEAVAGVVLSLMKMTKVLNTWSGSFRVCPCQAVDPLPFLREFRVTPPSQVKEEALHQDVGYLQGWDTVG